MPRKGITPVIAIVLLLMMTVAAAGGAYAWTSGLLDDFMGEAEDEAERGISIQNLVCYNQAPTVGDGAYVEVFFQNTGTKQLDLDPVDMNVRDRATGDINFTLTRTGLSLEERNLGPEVDFKFGDDFTEPGTSAAYIVGFPGRLERGANYEVEFVFTDEENTAHAEYCQAQAGGQDTYDAQEVSEDDGPDAVGRSIGISPGSLSGPGSVQDDETVVVTADLMNNGSERTRETMAFTIEDDTVISEDSTEVTLDPGESQELSAAFSPPSTGTYTLAAACDACTFNTREEVSLEVTESTSDGQGPNLALRSIDAPGTVSTGESFDAGVLVENTGDATGQVEATIALEDGSGQVLSQGTVSSELAANAETTLTTPFQAPDRGVEGQIRVTCSTCNGSTELTRPIEVEPPARPNIGIDAVRAPESVEQNETVDVYVTMRNNGTGSGQKEVAYELVDGATPVDSGSSSVSVDAGAQETVAFGVRMPDRAGNLTLEVRCDDCEGATVLDAPIAVTASPEEGGGLPIVLLVVVLLVLIAAVGAAVYYVNQRGEEKEQERQQRRQQYSQDDGQQPPRRRERGRRDQDDRNGYR
jgi:flagellin-like protein